MGWESRARGGLYYTRSRRIGGRVAREYVGTGAVGELAAMLDAEERQQRRSSADKRREEIAKHDELAGMIDKICQDIERVITAQLHAAGYHRHHRGEWRKRREVRGDAAIAKDDE